MAATRERRLEEPDLIALAEELGERMDRVGRNDWMRWLRLVERYGFDRAIHVARQWSEDRTLRDEIRGAYRAIAAALDPHRPTLKALPEDARARVLGYVGWVLKAREAYRGWR